MDIVEDPALRQALIDILVKEYKFQEPRDGIHASDLIYCLTRSWFNKTSYMPPTDDEVLRFSIGLGLERVIIQYTATRVEPLTVHEDGCDGDPCGCTPTILSPDFILDNVHSELKTTRWGKDHELSETWIKQVLAYCYATDHAVYNLTVLHIIQAVLRGYRLFFDREEIEENWGWMMYRKEILLRALEVGEAPKEFTFNEEWECNGCRYRLRCDLAASLRRQGLKPSQFKEG